MDNILSMFEHHILRQWFYEEPQQLTGVLINERSAFIMRVLNDFYRKENLQIPFEENEFVIELVKITEELYLIQILCPKPASTPECLSINMFFDLKFTMLKYYTVESTADGGQMLCSWSSDGCHNNYGECSDDIREYLDRCLKMYAEEFQLEQKLRGLFTE